MVKRLIQLAAANLVMLAMFVQLQAPASAPSAALKQGAIATAEKAQGLLAGRLPGPEYTLITTTLAPRRAKELSRHPDFAAVFVDWLEQAGVGPGTLVAVNFSGSFPALNISVLSAIQAIGAVPVPISSVGASTWGATDPEFTWLDMEARLQAAGMWSWRSTTASLGGGGDRGGGLTPEGKAMAMAAIQRNGIQPLLPSTLQEAIDLRLALYRESNHGELPAILVNVGGNHVVFGEGGHNTPLPEGLNYGYHPFLASHNGLAATFLRSNRPVIHVVNIARIAAKYSIDGTIQPGGSDAVIRRSLGGFGRLGLASWILANGILLWRWRTAR